MRAIGFLAVCAVAVAAVVVDGSGAFEVAVVRASLTTVGTVALTGAATAVVVVVAAAAVVGLAAAAWRKRDSTIRPLEGFFFSVAAG